MPGRVGCPAYSSIHQDPNSGLVANLLAFGDSPSFFGSNGLGRGLFWGGTHRPDPGYEGSHLTAQPAHLTALKLQYPLTRHYLRGQPRGDCTRRGFAILQAY